MIEGERLDRDQRLIVVHAKSCVITRARGRMEHGVGRQWPARIDAEAFESLDRRTDHGQYPPVHRTRLPGMRVETGNGEPGGRNVKSGARGRSQ